MNTDDFNKQLEKLTIEFSDKGFKMTKERANQWYSYMKNIDIFTFVKAIDKTIKYSKYSPSMADIFENIEIIKSEKSQYREYNP